MSEFEILNGRPIPDTKWQSKRKFFFDKLGVGDCKVIDAAGPERQAAKRYADTRCVEFEVLPLPYSPGKVVLRRVW